MVIFFRIAGFALCTLPAVISSLEHFPLWLSDRASTLSIFGLLVLLLAVLPFWKAIKHWLKSPSAWMLWFLLWLFLSLFRQIIDGLIAVSFVAFPFSMLGALCFYLAKRYQNRK
ncbi:MAG: hypothetical protein J6K61_04945 [Clostridia bacterium]|nr:hypothetical protein [Clostridia bacterium]